MAVSTRSGKFTVKVYDPTRKANRWVGTFESFEEAKEAEISARGKPAKIRQAAGAIAPWSLSAKGESVCRSCAARADHLHHIVPRVLAGDDDLSNGLPLCQPCHSGWHAHRVTITRDALVEAEIVYVLLRRGQAWLDRFYPRRDGKRAAEISHEIDRLRVENRELRAELAALRSQVARIAAIAGEQT